MTEFLFVILMGTVLLGLQTTSMGFLVPVEYKPDLMLILVVWTSLRATFMTGICFGFAAGIVMDLLSGAPAGLFALVYCVVFVACGYVKAVVSIDGHVGRGVLALGAALATGFAVLLERWLGGPVGFGWNVLGWIIVKSLITALTAVLLFPLIEWAWRSYSRLAGVR